MIRKIVPLSLVLAFAASGGPLPVQAAPEASSCDSRQRILAHLGKVYREKPVAMGLANNGGVIEVMRSADAGSFTIVITMPDGTSCMIAAGERWEDLPKTLVRGKQT